jgi:signal transduction histidine kinase
VSVWPSRFAGVVVRGQTWLNLGYNVLAFPTGLAYFIVLIVGVALGVGLAILVVGLAILLATLAAWRAFAALERGLARGLLGVPIPMPPDRRDLGAIDRVQRWLRDPVTWKSLVFVALKFPLGIVTFATVAGLGFVALVMLFSPLIVLGTPVTIFGWMVSSSAQALPLMLLGVPATLLILHLSNGLGWLWALFARVMLGPSTVQLHERVGDLRDARARIIAAGDAERRRIERDLHAGAQQKLVALTMQLGLARLDLPPGPAAQAVTAAHEQARQLMADLRDLIHGIQPQVLTELGLPAALSELADQAPVPVTVYSGLTGRLPGQAENTAYFAAAEALTNVAKHSGEASASVTARAAGGILVLEVRDDGRGGADPATGSGLTGLADRVAVAGGRMLLSSPTGGPTVLRVEIPCKNTSSWHP